MQYDAIVRIFVLPKSHAPHTLVVISLDPPIRKGQTHYPHILVQFPSDEEISAELEISDELFEAKNQAVSPHAWLCLHLWARPSPTGDMASNLCRNKHLGHDFSA